ncbi:putative glycoside hydrolase, partial [Globicatella sulfidifaciens]
MNTKRLLSITATILLASGCNQAQNQTSTPTYTELPTVESKLDAQTINDFSSRRKQNQANRYEGLVINKSNILTRPDDLPSSLFYDSGINISYPKEGVKGIYLPIDCVVNTEYFQESIDKLNSTALNSAVLDFKDDSGQILPIIESDNPMVNENVVGLADYKEVLKTFEQNNIYPIARIVTFKDNFLASSHPELSFQTEDGEIWT